ncbi:MAG TPA: glycosyltransferase [Chitinophagaceae bacterium]|nr:glycosyltransferase [Chitinophagaceae bacterium]
MKTTRTYDKAGQVELNELPGIIWLASWYPSLTSPTNGDFIQRHAVALSEKTPVLVIHTIHDSKSSSHVRYEVSRYGGLTEIIIFFRHSGDTSSFIGKLSYNRLFYRYTHELLDHLFMTYGKPECLHVHVPMKMGRVAIRAGRKWNLPYVVSEQSSKYLPGIEDGYDNRSWFYRYSVRQVFAKALAVSNVSAALGWIIGKLAGREDVKVIRNVADPSVFHYKPTEISPFTFIHASTLKSQKNIVGILNAFNELFNERQDFKLVVLGGDEDELSILRQQFGNAPWLELEGTVEHDQVAGYMQMANCLVMFSRDENFPCVIVEALCCGLPVISSDAGGCPEAINEDNGILVRSGHEDELLAAARYMIKNFSRYDQQEIAKQAAAQYGNEQIALDFISFYRNAGIRI